MSSPVIRGFLFDDENEEKIGRRGFTPWQLEEVLEDQHLVVPNRKRRRAAYLIIGRDYGGTCIAIPVEATHEPDLWRPITAWRCKDSERARLERG